MRPPRLKTPFRIFPKVTLTLLGVTLGVSGCASAQTRGPQVQAASAAATATRSQSDSTRYSRLTPEDYRLVAAELDIPVAAIRAVVEIEAGPAAKGFTPDSLPIINFDLTMFRQACARRKINLNKYKKSHAVVFNAPDRKKYGTTQRAQYARLRSAMEIDSIAAIEGTFWGMFQIGGFNWKLCGCSSPEDFVEKMSYSEREQLELFAEFLKARNLLRFIREKKWADFALRYNGPGYKKHRYDSKMAAAFRKFNSEEP